jgi:poly(3-hydroxybutyrate) depolymerase
MSTSGGTGPDKPNCKFTAHKTGETALQGALQFVTYAPPTYDKTKGHTMVIVMHGSGSDGTGEMRAFWKGLADRDELVLVAPHGQGQTGGNWGRSDEPKFLSVIDEVDKCYNINPKKHLLWGFSAGGNYGYLFGLSNAQRFMGLAMGGSFSYLGVLGPPGPGQIAWKVPFSHVNGTNDQAADIRAVRMEQAGFKQAGHFYNLTEHANGHSITAAQVEIQYNDLKGYSSP